jgi:hypothetical protein
VLLAATGAVCWPWCWPSRAVFVQRDSAFTVLASHHLQQALLGRRAWAQGPLGWPMPWSVTQADFTAGQGLFSWPFEALGIEPFGAMGVVAFLGLLLTAYCAHRLAQALLGPGPHTWVAGVAAACHPMHLAHAQHVNLVHHEWMVLGALLLGWGLTSRRPGRTFGGALVLSLAPWFGLYMGLHAALVGAGVLAVAALARQGDRRTWIATAAGLALGVLAFAPVLWTYARVAFRFEVFTDPGALAPWSWDPSTSLAPLPRAPLHRWLFGLDDGLAGASGDPANPGYCAAALALLGLVGWRRRPGPRWGWSAVVAILTAAMLLALGPVVIWRGQATAVPGPYRLLDWIPGFYGLRDPVRWLGVAFTALGPLAGLGAWRLVRVARRWGRWPAAGLGLLVVGALVAERVVPQAATPETLRLDPVYLELDSLPGHGPIWDDAVVLGSGERACDCDAGHAYRAALYHGRPLVGGTAARGTEASRALYRVLQTWPSAEAVELLRAIGAAAVLDHDGHDLPVLDGMSCAPTQQHLLCSLAPRTPLPAPEAVSTVGQGPVVGLRWEGGARGAIEVRCGTVVARTTAEVWQAVTILRAGTRATWVDFFFEQPCQEEISASPLLWTPLYADPEAPSWPPVWTGTGPGMAGVRH